MTDEDSDLTHGTRRAARARLLALLLGLAVSALLVAVVVFTSPRLRTRLTSVTPEDASIGIWENDSAFGYRHIPGAVGHHQVPDSFSVTYTIDSDGYRVTPDPAESQGRVLALGGSFTFGHGVEDGESWPAQLGRHWPHLKVVNAGVMGWGTSHSLLVLERELEREPPVLVIYGWFPGHPERNYIALDWLRLMAMYDRLHPHFELGPEGLEFHGVVGVEAGIPDGTPGLAKAEEQITIAMVKKIQSLCEARGIPLIVIPVLYPLPDWLLPLGLRVVDPDAYEGLPHDGHPTAASNAAVGRFLAEALRNLVPAASPPLAGWPDALIDPSRTPGGLPPVQSWQVACATPGSRTKNCGIAPGRP